MSAETNFAIQGYVVVEMQYRQGKKKPHHVATNFNLGVSDNLDKSIYLDEQDVPTAEGCQALTLAFVQGLIGNIHYAHQQGYRNDAEHLRYIISELERGLVQIAETK